MMKLSVFYDHILQAAQQSGESVESLLAHVKQCGIDAVEINLTYLRENPKTEQLLAGVGLKISCIYEFYEMNKPGLWVKMQWRKKSLNHIKTAKRVGAGKILVVPGFLESQEAEQMISVKDSYEDLADYLSANKNMQRMIAGLTYIAALGHEQGVTVTIEDFDDRKSPLCCMNGVLYALNNVPYLTHTFDMGNYAYIGEEVEKAWELLYGHITHVHCKDRGDDGQGNRLVSVATGSGYLSIEEMVKKLAGEKYDGYLAIEHFDAPNQKNTIKSSAEYLKNCAIY
ncbi:MAG: sugar phosphate isomerase/epimerase [Lachnospiraceae bacterium]|nr:sugar phosphate isomerase/epimerase [Lachnospiraceae bacterium]